MVTTISSSTSVRPTSPTLPAKPQSGKAAPAVSALAAGDSFQLSATPPMHPLFQANGVPFMPAYSLTANNNVSLFYDAAEIHPQLEKLIGEAKQSIRMDYFIFSGKQAMRLAELMVAKAKAGVDVQVMFDPRLGSLDVIKPGEQKVIDFLKRNGIQVAFANYDALPPQIDKKESLTGRLIDHNKIIVVDDRAAMIGGWNLADKFEKFHDAMVRIEGPAVADLAQQLAFDRYFALNPKAAKAGLATPAVERQDQKKSAPGLSTVRVNSTGINRQNNQWAILQNISQARTSIYATMLELDDPSIVDALIVAKNRGLDVRILLDPSDFSGLVPALEKGPREWMDAVAVKRLLDAGVQVRYFKTSPQQEVVHAKMAVFDGNEVMLGSADWQTKELLNTSDTSVEVHGGPAPAKAQRIFLGDWQDKSYPANSPALYKRLLSKLYFAFS